MTSGHFGFSYMGMIFLALLFIPNIIWTKKMPEGYTAERENRILLVLERTGEILTSCLAVIYSDFNPRGWTAWSIWLVAAFFWMALYELWWIRYFCSERKLADFYRSMLGIPVAGATLPVLAFFFLSIYGRVVWMLAATVILGVGHIGIHLQHRRQAVS